MTRIKALAVASIAGVAAAIAFATSAQAADPPGSWRRPLEPEQRFTELMSGWYLRGDVGYRFNRMDTFEAPVGVTSFKYPDSLGLTFGAGYKYEWFRADITVDYGAPVKARAETVTATLQPQYTGRIETITVLANAYLDLGTWAGFTPYVGAGIGGSYIRARDYNDTTLVNNYLPGNARTNFSWAAMAGIAFRINQDWMIDVGYRYLSLGDLETTMGSSLAVDQTRWQGLYNQEVRVGFRYLFD